MENLRDFLINELIKVENTSTCAAKHVACILYDSKYYNRGFVTGVNGSVVQGCTCESKFRKINGEWFEKMDHGLLYDPSGKKHKNWSIQHEVHAEIDALIKYSNSFKLTNALVTYSPCLDCCKSLIQAGINHIYYIYKFDNFDLIKELCNEANVKIERVSDEFIRKYESYR